MKKNYYLQILYIQGQDKHSSCLNLKNRKQQNERKQQMKQNMSNITRTFNTQHNLGNAVVEGHDVGCKWRNNVENQNVCGVV